MRLQILTDLGTAVGTAAGQEVAERRLEASAGARPLVARPLGCKPDEGARLWLKDKVPKAGTVLALGSSLTYDSLPDIAAHQLQTSLAQRFRTA